VPVIAQHFAELRGQDVMTGSVAGQINVPTAILAGHDDPFVSVDAVRTLQQSIPKATLRVCDSQRHFLPEEAPSEVAATIAELLARLIGPEAWSNVAQIVGNFDDAADVARHGTCFLRGARHVVDRRADAGRPQLEEIELEVL
jgi:hypothetical protein